MCVYLFCQCTGCNGNPVSKRWEKQLHNEALTIGHTESCDLHCWCLSSVFYCLVWLLYYQSPFCNCSTALCKEILHSSSLLPCMWRANSCYRGSSPFLSPHFPHTFFFIPWQFETINNTSQISAVFYVKQSISWDWQSGLCNFIYGTSADCRFIFSRFDLKAVCFYAGGETV